MFTHSAKQSGPDPSGRYFTRLVFTMANQDRQMGFLAVTKAGSDSSFKTTMAACTELSIDSAISSVLSDLESLSSLKEEQRTALKAFLSGKDIFALLPTGFDKSFIYQLAPLVRGWWFSQSHAKELIVAPPSETFH